MRDPVRRRSVVAVVVSTTTTATHTVELYRTTYFVNNAVAPRSHRRSLFFAFFQVVTFLTLVSRKALARGTILHSFVVVMMKSKMMVRVAFCA
jgi:hypothetical protein